MEENDRSSMRCFHHDDINYMQLENEHKLLELDIPDLHWPMVRHPNITM